MKSAHNIVSSLLLLLLLMPMVNESSHCVAYLVIFPGRVHLPPPLKKKVHRQRILLDLHPRGLTTPLFGQEGDVPLNRVWRFGS